MTISTPAIRVIDLHKTYVVPEREAGLKAALKSLIYRKTREVKAVDTIEFEIAPGEIVGFLGPNGAGKTTTLKMLSGLLYPSGGTATVLGHTPWRREKDYLRTMALVMGNRNQLQWDIPAMDSFELNRAIYHIPAAQFKRTRDEFIELMGVQTLVQKPIRNLSLGERMKMEFIGSLLHQPKVLFLDEPTIGLDVTMQRRIRAFIADYNQRFTATVMLTSHYMADVEALCHRVIVIHHGRILFDGNLSSLVDHFATYKKIVLVPEDPSVDLSLYGEVTERDATRIVLHIPKTETARVTSHLLADVPMIDLTIEEPPIDDVIEQLFSQEVML